MRLKLLFTSIFLVIGFACAGKVLAQSISDLDLGSLENLAKKSETQGYKNPFAQGSWGASDLVLEDLQLTGIVYRDANEAYALVSGYLVKIGDKIAGYKVDSIGKDKVILRRIDEVYVLSLGKGM